MAPLYPFGDLLLLSLLDTFFVPISIVAKSLIVAESLPWLAQYNYILRELDYFWQYQKFPIWTQTHASLGLLVLF